MPRQDLPSAFLPNGAIYYAKANYFLKYESFFQEIWVYLKWIVIKV